jgi:histidinol-phosphatase
VSYERELQAALGWADECDAIALEHFRVGVPAETKDDGTPVTVADTAIERTLRTAIERDFPKDSVLGEEEGATGSGGRRWIIDPIDGTKNYLRGIPAFGTLIALEDDDRVALGVVSAPALGARWWASAGGGAFRDGKRIRVSEVDDLERAEIASGGIDSFRRHGFLDGFLALAARVARQRGFGDFWGHMLVAQGSIEAMLEPAVAAWDVAALVPVVEEAGGRLTTVEGEARVDGGSALSTNGILHDQVLSLLAGDAPIAPPRGSRLGPEEALALYLQEARKLPQIAETDEQDLLARARAGDRAARKAVAESYLELAAMLALKHRPPGMREIDAIQEANVALMRLIDGSGERPAVELPEAVRRRMEKLGIESSPKE